MGEFGGQQRCRIRRHRQGLQQHDNGPEHGHALESNGIRVVERYERFRDKVMLTTTTMHSNNSGDTDVT